MNPHSQTSQNISDSYDQREAAYQAKKARVEAVRKAVADSKLDVYQAFNGYMRQVVTTSAAFGFDSPECQQAQLDLEAFVEPWLERAS